jgi:hypothetical protein
VRKFLKELAPLPGYVSNYVPRAGTSFSADFGGCAGVALRRLTSRAQVGVPLAARAQQLPMPVVGFMSGRSPEDSAHLVAAFYQGLSEAGFVEGQNVAIEFRWARARLPGLAAELRRVTVLIGLGGGCFGCRSEAGELNDPHHFWHWRRSNQGRSGRQLQPTGRERHGLYLVDQSVGA